MSNYINMMDIIYPVGSIYISMNGVSPAESIGGTWTQITDKFLRPSDNSLKEVGGNHTHNFEFSYASYYGVIPTLQNYLPDDNMFSFGPHQETSRQTSTDDHQMNISATAGWGSAKKPIIVTKIITTSEDSQIPLSITCYCWYRTA